MQTRDVRRRLMRVGVSYRDSSLIAERVMRQIRCSGSENTARYLKLVGQGVLWHLFKTGAKPAWVHTQRGFPTFVRELRSYPEEVKIAVAKLARVIRLPAATKKQLAKVVDGARSPFRGEESAVTEMTRFVNLGMSRLGLMTKSQPDANPILIGRQFSKVMSVSGPVQNTSAPPILESFRILKSWPELTALPNWQAAFEPLRPRSCDEILEKVDPLPRVCGEIHATQEGGAKLRMYASPYTAIQAVMSPVHDWFVTYLKQLPMNCTWDQLRGAIRAQAKLSEGFVFSLDLSTATCRFPLSVQLDMASKLGLSTGWLQAIEAISRGQWKVGRELDRRTKYLAWSVGQPLGMRFSMSMFSLCHNLLIAGIASDLGYNPWEAYNVLGDDVVIYHRPVAEVYSQLVQAAGIPISWDKSHQSTLVAEFAGATITRDLIKRPGQFREACPKNVLELCEQHGLLFHETSGLSLKVQKLHLFSKGIYTPVDIEEYKVLLRAHSELQVGHTDLPKFTRGRAPLWAVRVQEEFRTQLKDVGVKLRLVPKMEGGIHLWDVIPNTENARLAKQFHKDWSQFRDPLESALYWCWLSLYQDLCIGLLSVEEMVDYTQRLLDKLHSFLYLPPRSRSGATKFKRLLAYLLPKESGLREAA